MNSSFSIPAILFLVSLMVRLAYELLKEAHKINPASKPIFIVVFSAMCILWASWFSLCPADPYKLNFPESIRSIGLAVLILGTLLAVGALIQLRGVENIDHLVTTGLFRKIRHPMYLGFVSWLLGWSIYHSGMISLLFSLIGIISVLYWRHLEEKRLEVQFGDGYQQYRRTTWF
jgi:protein-S-isoprenylcysteine O-methyltransferase Ste14